MAEKLFNFPTPPIDQCNLLFLGEDGFSMICRNCGAYEYITSLHCPKCNHVAPPINFNIQIVTCANPYHNEGCQNPKCHAYNPASHAVTFAKMDYIRMPEDLKPFIEDGRLQFVVEDKDGSLCFSLPKHQRAREMINLTWYPLEHNPDAETHFELTLSQYRDEDCTDPVGSNELLDHPAKLEDLIDYLETERK